MVQISGDSCSEKGFRFQVIQVPGDSCSEKGLLDEFGQIAFFVSILIQVLSLFHHLEKNPNVN